MKSALPTAGVLGLAIFTLAVAAHTIADSAVVGKIVAIQDGDSLTLLDAEDEQHRVRLGGIDAPEKEQAFGYVSQVHLHALAFGKLAIADCPKVDRYGRQVCTVLIDGADIGLMQLDAGLAWHYKRFEQEQPVDERAAYARAEDSAHAARLGLWQDEHPIAPWDWRQQVRTPSGPQRDRSSEQN